MRQMTGPSSSAFKPRKALIASLCVGAGLMSAGIQAQTLDYGALETLFAEPVTTSVTGSPQRASRVPATMEIITAEEIRRSGAMDIPGILAHVTGADVLRWTNSGADVGVRGYNKAFSSRLLVLVNGRQVYADHYGYTPWATLPVELQEIRQIELVKGPNSALFGFNAAGGVINIITFSPLHDDLSFASMQGGSQDLMSGAASGTFAAGDAGKIRVTAGGRQNDDFSSPLLSMEEGSRRGDARESISADSRLTVAPNVELGLEASRTRMDQTSMAPAYVMGFEETDVRSIKGTVAAETRLGLVQATVYRNWIDNDVFASEFDGSSYAPSSEPIARFENEVTVAQLQHIFKAGRTHTFRLSTEYRESSLGTTPFAGGTVFYDVLSAGGLWQWQLDPAVAFTLALRRDDLSLGRKGPLPDSFGLTNADWNRSIAESSFNAGVVWEVTPRDTLRLTSARGAQLPSLYNLGGSLAEYPVPPEFQPPASIFVAGLPNLKPTVVTNHELAWDRQLSALGAKLRVAYFRGRSSAIVADSGAFLIEENIWSGPANIGDSRTEGFELSLDGTIADGWRWGVGYIGQDIEDDFPGFSVASSLTDFERTSPRHVVKANLGWASGPWEADGYLRHMPGFSGIRADDEFLFDPADPLAEPNVLKPVPRHTAFDASVAYRTTGRTRLALSGQNLFSSEQRQTSGPMVERRLVASITVAFD